MKKEFFVPGRMELSGNHTDHQKGRILASAVDLGHTAVCEPNGSKVIHIQSEGFRTFDLRVDHLAVRTTEFGTPQSLVRGVLNAFSALGLRIGGFNASITSTLPVGAGLSSSAAFSVLIGKILNDLFNGGRLPAIVIARAGLESENKYFGKPCGIMSQIACAFGRTVYVDLETGEIEPISVDFDSMGLTMCLTDTGGSHAGLDTSYARIPADMKYIANLFDKGVLGDVDPAEFRSKGWDPSDRPVRRAMHFFDENDRVPKMRDALKAGDGLTYMRLMNESGRSSEQLLNNIITSATGDTKLAQGLELSKKLLEGRGAWRVHGGGFAGCVQALMPTDMFAGYKAGMEKVFGVGSCRKVHPV
ncbi:MAG: galactokinase family protein [Candidatus Limivicinus sp.]|nr:galactokinase family protein [Candidatus Limivicinus sp.]